MGTLHAHMQPLEAAARIVHFAESEADGCTSSATSEMRLLHDANYLVRRARIYGPVIVRISPAARSRTGSILRSVGCWITSVEAAGLLAPPSFARPSRWPRRARQHDLVLRWLPLWRVVCLDIRKGCAAAVHQGAAALPCCVSPRAGGATV